VEAYGSGPCPDDAVASTSNTTSLSGEAGTTAATSPVAAGRLTLSRTDCDARRMRSPSVVSFSDALVPSLTASMTMMSVSRSWRSGFAHLTSDSFLEVVSPMPLKKAPVTVAAELNASPVLRTLQRRMSRGNKQSSRHATHGAELPIA
jgi:hypothetical protein